MSCTDECEQQKTKNISFHRNPADRGYDHLIHDIPKIPIKMSNAICAVTDEIKLLLKDFRFRKEENTAALILKVDREKQLIILDEKLEDITIEELQESLPSHQPRYVILSYKQEHADGRVSFPLCFIYYTPRDSHAELQMMYAGSKISLQRDADLTRAYEIRELEDLNEEWLLEKLGK